MCTLDMCVRVCEKLLYGCIYVGAGCFNKPIYIHPGCEKNVCVGLLGYSINSSIYRVLQYLHICMTAMVSYQRIVINIKTREVFAAFLLRPIPPTHPSPPSILMSLPPFLPCVFREF